MQHSDSNLFSFLKPHGSWVMSVLAGLCSVIVSAFIFFGNYQRHDATTELRQQDLERRIVLLENDRATRVEVQAVGAELNDFRTETRQRFDKLETLILRDLAQH